MKHAPSYFEYNAGSPQLHVPAASKDTVEFNPADYTPSFEVKEWEDMTPEEREAIYKLF